MLLQLISFTFLSIRLSNADCNLLESGNTAYIETESKSTILEMCSKEQSSLSLWEQYQCDYIRHRDGWRKCWPQRRMSNCPPGDLKGTIFLYHGYSACPDQYNNISIKLQDNCYHVYQILTIGHGYDGCDDNSTDSSCTAAMFNLTDLPTVRQPYIDYINKTMLNAIKDEVSIIKECESTANSAYNTDNLEVVVGGLSFGAPLAAATVVLSGADSVFTKQILMSPFFGITYQGFDNLIYKCLLNTASFRDCLPTYFTAIGFNISDDESDDLTDLVMDALSYYVDLDFLDTSFETLNLLVRKIIEWVVEEPDLIGDETTKQTVNDVLDTVISWGSQCVLDIEERNRGGFCSFSVRNLAASHSFGQYVTEIMGNGEVDIDTSIETLLILVERDGPTRNSLAANYVQLFYGNDKDTIYEKANDCMWLIAEECQEDDYEGAIDNTCGVPHSSMAEADNTGIVPYYLYWNETYHQGIIDFINGETDFGDNFIVKSEPWDGSRDQCVYLDIIDPPEVLIADVPSLMTIGLSIVGDTVNDAVQETILNAVASLTGVPRGILELTYNLVVSGNENIDTDDGDYYEFQMALDEDGAQLMTTLLDNDAITEVANYSVTYVEVDGNEYYLVNDEPSTTEEENDSGVYRVVVNKWVAMVGVYILISYL